MAKTGISLDVKLAVNMLNDYGKKVDEKQERVVADTARMIKSSQFRTLLVNVKEWTGNLAGSIDIFIAGKSAVIGPNTATAPYAQWIEDGTTRGNASFLGYHYVRDSIRKHQYIFFKRIHKSIK